MREVTWFTFYINTSNTTFKDKNRPVKMKTKMTGTRRHTLSQSLIDFGGEGPRKKLTLIYLLI